MYTRWLITIALFITTNLPGAIKVQSEAACLIDGNTGELLYAKDAHSIRNPASITKIATAVYIITHPTLNLDAEVEADQDSLGWVSAEKKKKANYTLPPYWLEPDGTQMGVQVGEKVTTRDLLYGMMLASGNDCANLLAKQYGGEIPEFMKRLNTFLSDEIGCEHTNFVNPHGLYHPEHKTTAYEMALIAKAGMQSDLFRSLVSSKEYLRAATNKTPGGDSVRQSNKLLRPGKHFYRSAVGIKTGYVAMAKHTFVGAAEKDGRLLIAVLLGNEDRDQMFQDSIHLLEEGFKIKRVDRLLFAPGKQNFSCAIKKGDSKLQTYLKDQVAIHYYEGREPKVRCQLEWQPKLKAPIQEGQLVGHLIVFDDQKELERAPLYAAATVQKSTWTPRRVLAWVAGGAVLFLLGALAWELRRK